jgi:hypothetical protein
LSLDQINKWLIFVANLGVLVGIYFLIAELDQSNRIAEGEARDRNASAEFQLAQLISDNERLLDLSIKLRESNPELSPVEDELARHLATLYVSNWGKLVVQNSTGLLPEKSLSFSQSGIEATINGYPGLAAYIGDYLEARDILSSSTNPIWEAVWKEVQKY